MTLWNSDRKEVYRLIAEVHPTLAALYHKAIELIATKPATSGEARVTLALVGHCFRELLNRLPDALRDVEGLPGSKRGEEHAALSRLRDAYSTYIGMPGDQNHSASTEGLDEMRLVAVPQSLLDALATFVAVREAGSLTVRQRDAVTVLGAIDPLDPALKPWTKARDYFMSLTHLTVDDASESTTRLPSDTETVRHVQAIEASLRVRLGAFFDNLAELEDLIAAANRTDTEEAAL